MDRAIFFAIAMIIYLIYRAVFGEDKTVGAHPTGTLGDSRSSYPFSEISPDPKFPQVRSFRTKIRGVTYTNADGTERQSIIRNRCHPGDALYCVREPANQFDSNAIQILRIIHPEDLEKPERGEQLGYLSRDIAQEFAPRMDDDGFLLMAQILNITGGENGEAVGVNIEVAVYMRAPQQDTARRRVKKRKNLRNQVPAKPI